MVFGSLTAHAAWAQTAGSNTATPPAPSAGGGNATSTTAAPAAPAAPAPAPTVTPVPPTTPVPPPAATPPATINLTPTPPAPSPPSKGGHSVDTGVGLSPSAPELGGGTNLSNKEAASLTPSTSGAADEWKFDFHGYLRAPLRVSFGPATPLDQPTIYSPTPANSYPPNMPPPTSGFQLHSPPRVPGMQYTTWEYTNTVSGPWSQLNFSYGNSKVTATVVVDAYNETDGSYRNLQAQQGIDQAFITLSFPDVFKDYGGLTWNVGTFQNRYGAAGKYDGGMYETYLFGRTHQTGETLTATFSNLDAHGDWTFTVEHGIGAKMDIVPFQNNANYQVFQNVPIGGTSGSPYLSDRSPDYLPYAGPVPMGSTFVNHVHVGAKYQKTWTFGLHYIYVWTPDDNWSPRNSTQTDVSDAVPRSQGPIQGSMAIAGPEVRFDGGAYGYGYLGWSHIDARNINALADILEVLHSYGGYQFKQNFFGQTFNFHSGVYNGPENETGTVDNIMAQYTFSLGAWNRAPEDWWGDGPDLVFTAFGLLSIVDSKAPPIALAQDPSRATTWDMSTKKLKFGIDGLYTPLDWLGVGGRFDMVMPDLDSAYSRTPGNPGGSSLDFGVLTAKAVIRTAFVTHESVTLEYQHYLLGSDAFPPYPYGWVPKADANLASIYATMWW
ncbi:MAG TPA: hypothetical protein VKZ18_20575 [Polyangia bacterium]|nr:hypothetical protein [Polyangia bacterium]